MSSVEHGLNRVEILLRTTIRAGSMLETPSTLPLNLQSVALTEPANWRATLVVKGGAIPDQSPGRFGSSDPLGAPGRYQPSKNRSHV